jgi:hypothetical protein
MASETTNQIIKFVSNCCIAVVLLESQNLRHEESKIYLGWRTEVVVAGVEDATMAGFQEEGFIFTIEVQQIPT